jgi:hypothetical protein
MATGIGTLYCYGTEIITLPCDIHNIENGF